MNKRDLSRYFSGSALSRMPLHKALVALCCVLILTVSIGAGIAITVVNAASNSAIVEPTNTNFASDMALSTMQPDITPTPEPAPTAAPIQLKLEVTAVQQSIGITVMNADDDMPVLNQVFEVSVTYNGEDSAKSNQKATKQYSIDPKTGTLLIQQAEIGDYTVSLDEQEGYVTPDPVNVSVKEKVEYKADIQGVKDQIKQSNQVNESTEDSGKGTHSGAGVDTGATPALPTADPTSVPTAAPTPTPTPSGNDYDYNDSSVQEEKATVYVAETVSQNGRQYLKYSDGTISPYYVSRTGKTLDGTEYLIEAVLDSSMVSNTAASSQVTDSSAASNSSSSNSDSTLPTSLIFYDETMLEGVNQPGFLVTAIDKVMAATYSGWYPSVDNKQAYYDPITHKKVTGTKIIAGKTYRFDDNGAFLEEVISTPVPTQTPTPQPTSTPTGSNNGDSGQIDWTKGVDVSKYQGNIDWNKVKASGIDFAIIRVGYRGYGTGVLVEDSSFRQNIKGATAAGLKVGLYFYSQAINEQEAVEEASMVLSLCSGYNISYPIYFDTEKVDAGTGRADNISRAQRTANAVAFCETIQNAGYRAGVYSYASWFYNQLNIANINKYSIWIAQYRSQLDFDYNYDIWQYTSIGTVPGIPNKTDMNLSKLG